MCVYNRELFYPYKIYAINMLELEMERIRRKKSDIESLINRATIELIKEGGFSNVTIRKIAQKGKFEAVVFYNRYKDVDEFIGEFVKKYDYWLDDIDKKTLEGNNCKERYINTLTSLFDSLQTNEVMQELLKWEISSNNDITSRTAKLREFYTIPLVEKYKKEFENSPVNIDSIAALIVGGIYYLILHSDVSMFSGIDINTKDGKEKIIHAIEYLGDMIFSKKSCDFKILTMAKKMKGNGMEITTIAEYTDLSIDVITNL